MKSQGIARKVGNGHVSRKRGDNQVLSLPNILFAIEDDNIAFDDQTDFPFVNKIFSINNFGQQFTVGLPAVDERVLGEIGPRKLKGHESTGLKTLYTCFGVVEHVAHEFQQQFEVQFKRAGFFDSLVQLGNLVRAEIQRSKRLCERGNLGGFEMDVLLFEDVLEGGNQDGALDLNLVVFQREVA